MKKYIEVININRNKNNTNGAFTISNKKVFFKELTNLDYTRELEGYNILKKHYDVANMYADIQGNILLYEYDNSIYKDNGLLVDYFANNNKLNTKYINILKKYQDVFLKTIKNNKKGNCRMFFEERIDTRLKNNANTKFFKALDNKTVDFNHNKINLENSKIYSEIQKYFCHEKNTWNIISNADPNDMNIGMNGKLFDYTAGGYVPLMCEFAVFVCYNLIQSEYLSLKYNNKSFVSHKKIYRYINRPVISKNKILYKTRGIRIEAVSKYIDIVIKPVMKKIRYDDWYVDFKNYLAMKVLAVYDYNKMSKKDILLSSAFLNIFYNSDIKDITELKRMIKKIMG